jgi:hypothetical protein
MAELFHHAGSVHRGRGFSRRAVLLAGCLCLLVALVLTFAWQNRIFSHLDFENAKTEILNIELLTPYSSPRTEAAPPFQSMQGGVILHIKDHRFPGNPAPVL